METVSCGSAAAPAGHDLIGHQLPTTFDQIDNSDPAWMERLGYTGHPVPGCDVIFDIGLGYHPNRNVMDAFAGVAVPGRQWNFRASRRLRPDPLTTSVGPLAITVPEGLRRHRLVLGENDSGIHFEIEFHATTSAHEEEAHQRRRDGRVTENMARAQQLGRYSGWIEFDGRRMQVDSWCGQRDHSWGVRAEMRSDETHPPLTFYPPFFTAGPPRSSRTAGCTSSSRSVRPARRSTSRAKKSSRPAARSRGAISSSMWATRRSGSTTRRASRWPRSNSS